MNKLEDTITLLAFLFWLQQNSPNAMWGGKKIDEAIDAACRLCGIDRERAKKIILKPETIEPTH